MGCLLGCMSIVLGCGDDDDDGPIARDDGSVSHDGSSSNPPEDPADAGDGSVGSGGGGASGSQAPPVGGGVPFDGGVLPSAGSLCTLAVAAECDGPEDCPVPQSCCAISILPLTYSVIACRQTCDRVNEYELCHADQGGCRRSDRVCQRSQIIPHDFITVCSNPTNNPLPTANSSQAIDDVVVCGSDRCVAGKESCCLRSELDFARRQTVALEPYCAPIGSPCTCNSQPGGPSDEDGGIVTAP